MATMTDMLGMTYGPGDVALPGKRLADIRPKVSR